MDLLTSIKGFLETSLFPQLSYKSFKTFLKPLTTILRLAVIRRAASQVAKLVRRIKLEETGEEVEHLRQRFFNDLFCVAKFIHILEGATTITRTQRLSGKFKGFLKMRLTTSCPKHSSLTFFLKMQSAL